jgi:hypothetical protein
MKARGKSRAFSNCFVYCDRVTGPGFLFRGRAQENTFEKNTSPFAALLSRPIAAPLSIKPLDNTVEDEAHPQIHHQSEVNPERLMTSRWRQVWHQGEEVEQAAQNHGDELLEKSS